MTAVRDSLSCDPAIPPAGDRLVTDPPTSPAALASPPHRAPVGLVTVAMDGTVRTVNATMAAWLGVTPTALRTTGLAATVHPAQSVTALNTFLAVDGADMEPETLEPPTRFRTAGGETVWLRLARLVLRDAEGAPRDVLILATNVTADVVAWMAAEEARREAESALADALRTNLHQSDFFALVGNALVHPTRAILGYTSALANGVAGPIPEVQRALLTHARTSGQHLLKTVQDLQELAEAEAGHIAFAREPVDVAAVVEEALQETRPCSLGQSVSVRYLRPSSGPARSGSPEADDVPLFARSDTRRVRQILSTLLHHCCQACPPRTEMTVGVYPAPHPVTDALGITIRVTDAGNVPSGSLEEALFGSPPTVDPEQAERELSPPDVPPRQTLGLAVARRLAQHLGGALRAERLPVAGVAFYLWLPAAQPVLAAPSHDLRVAFITHIPDILAQWATELASLQVRRDAVGSLPASRAQSRLRRLLLDVAPNGNAARNTTPALPTDHRGEPGGVRSIAIHSIAAAQHGIARAREGWTAQELECELETLHRVVDQHIRTGLLGETGTAPVAWQGVAAGLADALDRCRTSYRTAAQRPPSTGGTRSH